MFNKRIRIYHKHYKKSGFVMRSHKGFTLVELIVTLSILGIMLTLSVSGLMSWRDWSDFNRVNEYAETMFLAAQNQLTEYSANGNYDDFKDRVSQKGVFRVPVESVTAADGSSLTEDMNRLSGEDTHYIWMSENKGTLVSVRADKGDYSRYLQGAVTNSETAPFVFELLDSYIYDQSLLNETVCIEFSLEDGQIFSVFFTDKYTSDSSGQPYAHFEYSPTENLRGSISILDRRESFRKERMVGYYGVDTLSKAIKGKKGKPSISKLWLYNEETLNLAFKVGKIPSATQALNYDINIYDASNSSNESVSFTIDGSKLKNYANRQTQNCEIVRRRYDSTSDTLITHNLGEMPMLAWIESDGTIRIVLDAADFQASSDLYVQSLDVLYRYNADADAIRNDSDFKKLSSTYSFHRFGLDVDQIYCDVKAYGAGYKSTATKSSNIQHAYFWDMAENTDTQNGNLHNVNYEIKNARHLYNMRYVTDLSEQDLKKASELFASDTKSAVHFQFVEDVDWAAFVKAGYYFDTKSAGLHAVTDREDEYVSLKQLRKMDEINGNDHVISGLRMSEMTNAVSLVYGTDANAEKPVGFICTNFGIIHNLKLDNVTAVSTSDKVGAFCGINVCASADSMGTLYDLETLNSGIGKDVASTVIGKEHVGGIVGYLQGVGETGGSGAGVQNNGNGVSASGLQTVVLSNLKNAAQVSGTKFVGGIVGEVRTPEHQLASIEIRDCENTGAVLARTTVGNKTLAATETGFIGGITGYAANMYVAGDGSKNEELIRIVGCRSVPEYSDTELSYMLDMDVSDIVNTLKGKLNGVYVGGIVGYNYYSKIETCKTEIEKDKTGYVFGHSYVGGIAGYNRGPASGITGSDGAVNGANVVGVKYVGGITGCNAEIQESQDEVEQLSKVVEPMRNINLGVKISNWTNKGVVFATDSYAGGISGYNTGWIFNCDSKMDLDSKIEFFQTIYSGDYAGGIAGYNNGIIGNTVRDEKDTSKITDTSSPESRKKQAVCYISGHNYIGGIVGYNDAEAIVEDYAVAGGEVRGTSESCFVGGYAGFNASVWLLQDENNVARLIESNPNSVYGGYFVGGTIGGNIINIYGNSQPSGVDDDILIERNWFFDNWNVDGTGTAAGHFAIAVKNTSNVTTTSWRVEMDVPEGVTISPYGTVAMTRDGNHCVFSSMPYCGNDIAPGEVNNTSLQFTFTNMTQQDYVAFVTAPISVYLDNNFAYYGSGKNTRVLQINGGSAQGNSLGASGDICEAVESQTSFTVGRHDNNEVNYWTDNGKQIAEYTISVTNSSSTDALDWGVEVSLPSGTILYGGDGWSAKLSVVNGHLIAVPRGDYEYTLRAGETKSIKFQLAFEDINTLEDILTTPITLYKNYSKKTAPGTPNTSTVIGDLHVMYRTDNFVGRVEGTAFIGGFTGYNLLLNNADAGHDKSYVYDVQNKLIEKILTAKGDLPAQVDCLDTIHDASFGLTEPVSVSDVMMVIDGNTDGSKTNALAMVCGELYVGGVVGYNDDGSKVTIQNVVNATPIIANSAIAKASEQNGRDTDYKGNPITFKYSYAGGIAGKVSENMIIDNCSNLASAIIETKGTYSGGLCEINDGIIQNCMVSSLGFGSTDYIGGLCGVNSKEAEIIDCVLQRVTINGRNLAGGIASENFGKIINPIVRSATMNVQGESGAIAAYNGDTGVISLQQNLNEVHIVSSGDFVGGVVGVNDGAISNDSTEADGMITLNGSVKGRYSVGGFIGKNRSGGSSTSIEKYVNRAAITALWGNAGGIVGDNTSENTSVSKIESCINYGAITAQGDGYAGGICGVNEFLITGCTNYGIVLAPNGMCGGIVAENKQTGEISDCHVAKSDALIGTGKLPFCSNNEVGGIAAVNAGRVYKCTLKNVKVINYISSGSSNIGVVVGRNEKTGIIVFISENGDIIEDCEAKTYTEYSNVGGVAGINYGTILGLAADEMSKPLLKDNPVISCEIGFESFSNGMTATVQKASIANMGGIAGVNYGSVSNLSVDGSVVGDLGTAGIGYGGIAGVSGSVDDKVSGTARIEDCTFDGVVSANGSADREACIGGITGVNASNSTISGCAVGVRDTGAGSADTTSILGGNTSSTKIDTVSYTNIGGVAGYNCGKVYNCDNKIYSVDNVEIISYAGSSGGIAGLCAKGSVVDGISPDKPTTTGGRWLVEARNLSNNTGNGGIVGYTFSGQDYSYLYNYAEVKNTYKDNSAVGGIIGRSEAMEGVGPHLYECYNYGRLYAYQRIGGIIGNIKYRLSGLENCYNYGEVTGNGTVGGIVGICQMVPQVVLYENCENHGNLKALSGGTIIGGILGQNEGQPHEKESAFLYNCVNTGVITVANNTSVGGMVGKYTNNTLFLFQCRNYGTGMRGLVGHSDKTAIQGCLDVCGTTYNNSPYGECPQGFSSDDKANGISGSKFSFYIGADSTLQSDFKYACRYMDNKNVNVAARLLLMSTDGEYNVFKPYYNDSETEKDCWFEIKNNPTSSTYTKDKTEYTLFINEENGDGVNKPVAYPYKVQSDYTTAGCDSNRIETYKELDAAYLQFLYGMYATDYKLPAPSAIKYETKDSRQRIKWTVVDNAYGYLLSCTLVDAEGNVVMQDGEPVYKVDNRLIVGDSQYLVPTNNAWKDAGYHYSVSVVAVNGYHMLHMNDTSMSEEEKAQYDSDATTSDVTAMKILPTPILHIEHIGEKACVAVLENREDYKDADGNYLDCYIEIQGQNSLKIQVKDSAYSAVSTSFNPSVANYSISARAVAQGATKNSKEYGDYSQRCQIYAMIVSPNNIISAKVSDYYGITSDGFTGDTPETLIYDIHYNKWKKTNNGSGEINVNSDIMAYDDELKATVSYAHGTTKITFTSPSSSRLANLPMDIVGKEQIIMCSYAWRSQTDALWYGHIVAENFKIGTPQADASDGAVYYKSLADITDPYLFVPSGTTYVRPAEAPSVWDASTEDLKNGYVLYCNDDGTYTLIYSSTLALHTDTKPYLTEEKVYTYNTDGINEWYEVKGVTLPIQMKPQIEEDYETALSAEGRTLYTFTWDKDRNYANAVYNVKLEGEKLDGTYVILGEKTNLTEGVVTFEDEQDNWNYPKMHLTVTRVGAVNADNVSTALPNVSEKEFLVKIRLTTMGIPSVQLVKNADGTYNQDNYLYDVEWEPLSNTQELEALAGYKVVVRKKYTDLSTGEEYYLEDMVSELLAGTMTESGRLKTVVDLSQFEGNDELFISIRAVAKADSELFKDSALGTEYPLTLKERLTVKTAADIICNRTYDSENPISMEDINGTGIKLDITETDADIAAITGKYQLAIAIFETAPAVLDETEKVAQSGDATEESPDGHWNSGALVTVYGKDNPTKMVGEYLSGASLTLKSNNSLTLSDYAGMWMKIAVRSTSNNMISSLWSDESTDGVSYKWVQIPRVRLDVPGMTNTDCIGSANMYFDGSVWSAELPNNFAYMTVNRTVSFATKDYTDVYEVQITDCDGNINQLLISRDSGAAAPSYDVYYLGEDGGTVSGNDIEADHPYEKWLGTLNTNTKELTLPYKANVNVLFTASASSVTQVTYNVHAILQYEETADNKGTFKIILPDILKHGENDIGLTQLPEAAYVYTSDVTVRGCVDDGKLAGYADSYIGYLHRAFSQGELMETAELAEQATLADGVLPSAVSAEEITDAVSGDVTAYKYTFTGSTVLLAQLVVMDENDVVRWTECKGLSMSSADGMTYTGTMTLDKDYYFGTSQTQKIAIRFAAVNAYGIGTWTPFHELKADTTTPLGNELTGM